MIFTNPKRRLAHAALVLLAAAPVHATAPEGTPAADYLAFDRGALPVALEDDAAALGIGFDHALRAIDGDPGGFGLTPRPGGPTTRVSFVYSLPAETTFERFAVPNVLETPSPSQTFVREVEIAGSNEGPGGPFRRLGSARLEVHPEKGRSTAFAAEERRPVRWVRVSLSNGLDVQREKTFFEFSEIVGLGSQAPVPRSSAFAGKWKGRGVVLELEQDGDQVAGCYDGEGDLAGTVEGNLLRATGSSRRSGVASAFVLAVTESGAVTGVRSTNGAPFKLYSGDPAPSLQTECSGRAVAAPGCGSILHGIRFAYDSAAILPDSHGLLDVLARSLEGDGRSTVRVVGHTSSEGDAAYNEDLSKRRAEAVAAALAERGLERKRLASEGRGEREPIADDATEAGRSLNRRVEIVCP